MIKSPRRIFARLRRLWRDHRHAEQARLDHEAAAAALDAKYEEVERERANLRAVALHLESKHEEAARREREAEAARRRYEFTAEAEIHVTERMRAERDEARTLAGLLVMAQGGVARVKSGQELPAGFRLESAVDGDGWITVRVRARVEAS